MKHSGRDEWLRDITARQRNIVFPDTLNNETRGWRNLIDGGRPTLIQKLGILVLLLFVAAFASALMFIISDGFTKSGLVLLLAICAGTVVFIGLVLVALRIGIAGAAKDIRQGRKN